MRIAVLSDIHDNITALEAVLADLRETSPDLILHGGDLVHGGSSPVEVLDQIRDLGWPGVIGNTDEMLFRPESLTEFASSLPQLQAMFAKIGEMAAFSREKLGDQRLAWLSKLPKVQVQSTIALVHATPDSVWRTITPEAADAELESVYSPLNQPIAIYGHVHRPYIRTTGSLTVINTGSVGLSHDGDVRASYLLLDGTKPTIRRVEYDLDKELKALATCGLPYTDWTAKILKTARPQMP
jgi:putative phosphoesterase